MSLHKQQILDMQNNIVKSDDSSCKKGEFSKNHHLTKRASNIKKSHTHSTIKTLNQHGEQLSHESIKQEKVTHEK